MMTLDEQKLKVCEKLPGLIATNRFEGYNYHFWKIRQRRGSAEIHWPTEGLQVCHEWIAAQPREVQMRVDFALRQKALKLNKPQCLLKWEEIIEEISCCLNDSGGE